MSEVGVGGQVKGQCRRSSIGFGRCEIMSTVGAPDLRTVCLSLPMKLAKDV